MPSLAYEKSVAKEATEVINLESLDLERFVSECPSSFGPDGLTPSYLWNKVIEGKPQELLFFTLDELNNLYFNDAKLSELSKLCHTQDGIFKDSISVSNCSLYVTVGMRDAYESEFSKNKSLKNSSLPDSICLKARSSRGSKRNYEEIFVDFFNNMFASNESDKLEKTYTKDNMLTICIFARSSHKTKTNLIRFNDQLIGAASFVMDKIDSVLLSWLGVIEKTLAELEIHDTLKTNNSSLRRQFNIGTFMLIICQVFKSTIQKKWCPVVCQVHGDKREGPLDFYYKNFFIQTSEMYQIVYSQLIHRKDSIIYDDYQLVWMVLLYPLNDLLMTCIDRKDDWTSFYLILKRGYYYFLNRNRIPLQQDAIETCIQSYCNDNPEFYKSGCTLHIPKDIIDDIESYEKFLDENEKDKPTILSAGSNVLQTFIDLVNNHNQSEISLFNCGNGVETSDNNSLFLAISKIIYGSAHYYINLRLFLCFYYRSVSKLSRNHPFYTNADIDMMIYEILGRIYNDNIPANIYLPGSEKIVDPARYRRIIYRLSQHLMNHHVAAEYHDLYLFASMFGVEFIVIEGRSNQFILEENIKEREWKINFQKTFSGNHFINQCLIKVNPRPKKWLACMYESQFMPIIQTNDDSKFDDITFMIPSVGLQSYNNDAINLCVLSQETTLPDHDMLEEMYSLLQREPFKIIRNIQKMYNVYSDSTTITKYIRKGLRKIPGSTNKEYGKLMSCSDFQEAGVPDEYILGCIRCLDPPLILVENNIWPISNQCQFTDLMHLRKGTWLNETCTKLFIDYLSTQTDQYFFLDPASFNNTITQSSAVIELISTRQYEEHPEKDIILLFHIKDHFIVVEIRRSMVWEELKGVEAKNDNESNSVKTPVYLACSLGQELSSLIKQVEECHLEVFLNILFERDMYEYRVAEYVQKQNNNTSNECGVICLQRLYKYTLFGCTNVDLPNNLQSPIMFRCFILYKILEFRRNDVSPFVLYNEEKLAQFLSSETKSANRISENLLQVAHQEFEMSKTEEINTRILLESEEETIRNEQTLASGEGDRHTYHVQSMVLESESMNRLDTSTVLQHQIDETIPQQELPILIPKLPSSPPNVKSMKRKVASITQMNEDENDEDAQTSPALTENVSRLPILQGVVSKTKTLITQVEDDDENTEDAQTSSTLSENDKDEDDTNLPVKQVAKKPKTRIKFRIPASIANNKNEEPKIRRTNIQRTPTRVSSRILNQKIISPNVTAPRKLTAQNKIQNPREPKNYAIGFSVAKKPNTLTPATKKRLQAIQEKKSVIDARKKQYDEFQECDLATDSEGSDNVVDLFEDDEWYFIDKQLLNKQLPASMTSEDKHKPEVYLPLLYDPFQHSSKEAETIVQNLIKPKFEKAKNAFTDAETKLNRLLKRYGDRKSKLVEKAREEYTDALIKKEMLNWEMTGQKVFLPYDSIYAIQAVPSENIKGEYDYYAVTDNPNGKGFAKKMVSKGWLDDNVDGEFMSKVNDWKDNNGWVTFNNDLKEFKVIQQDNNLNEALQQFNLNPVYQYKPLRGDDEILIVRCEVSYDQYDNYTKVKKMNWTVLTSRESFSLTPKKVCDLPNDPLEENEEGERLHKSTYNNISKELLCSIIGCEFVFLFETASVLCGQHERRIPFRLSPAPKFKFADDFDTTNKLDPSSRSIINCKSSVTIDSTSKRMYDEKDMLPKNQRHCMPLDFIGDFSHPQYYYYDMRQFTKRYFVHCVSTQISGLYFDETKNKFFGLCKKEKTNHDSFVHHIELEDDWVEENFRQEFLELVKKKSKKDQRKFIKLPIGKAKPISSPECNLKNPFIQFLQNGKDNCVFASIASTLAYMGFQQLARYVMKYEEEFVKTQFTNNTYGSVLGTLNFKIGTFKIRDFNKKYRLARIRDPDKFDLIENATNNPNILYHVVLVGSDGSENHCVCVYNNFIFVGNYTHAWSLKQSSLNECIDSTFIGINDGYMRIPNA